MYDVAPKALLLNCIMFRNACEGSPRRKKIKVESNLTVIMLMTQALERHAHVDDNVCEIAAGFQMYY